MGMECPKGHGRQNVTVNITTDGRNATKSQDVIAHRLACGCVVGGEKYEQFKKAVNVIDRDKAAAIIEIEEEARQKSAAVYQTYISGRPEA